VIRAAVFDGPGLPFRLTALPYTGPAAGEVIVRVALCTICGSDLHTTAGRRHGPTPCVLGHEVVGTVEAVGEGARDVAGRPLDVGRRVAVGVGTRCGACFYCTRALPQKCESLVKLGHTRAEGDDGPFGGLATHCRLPAGAVVVPVPDGLPDEVAAPAGCAAATATAVLRTAGPEVAGGCVVIFGAGMLGLTAAAMATARGAAAVVVCDVDVNRLLRSRAFGATHTIPLPDESGALSAVVRDQTGGRGADVVLELSGAPVAAAWGIDTLRTGGKAVWAGGVLPTEPVAVLPERVVRGCLTVAGVHNYMPSDLETAVEFLAAHHIHFPFAELVEVAYPLTAVDEAFHVAATARPVRVGVRPNDVLTAARWAASRSQDA